MQKSFYLNNEFCVMDFNPNNISHLMKLPILDVNNRLMTEPKNNLLSKMHLANRRGLHGFWTQALKWTQPNQLYLKLRVSGCYYKVGGRSVHSN